MNDHSGTFGNDFEPLDEVRKRTKPRNKRRTPLRSRKWNIRNPFSNRSGLWWIDFICASLSVLGMIHIIFHFEDVCIFILYVICNLMSVLGVIAIIAAILLCILFSIRSRRRRYWW